MNSNRVASGLLLLLATAQLMPKPAFSVTCGEVAVAFAPCLPYLLGFQAKPAAICCGSVRLLSNIALTVDDRRMVCNCVKQAAVHILILKEERIALLLSSCFTTLPFPSNLNSDCNQCVPSSLIKLLISCMYICLNVLILL